MSNKSFISTSGETEDIFSDFETKEFIKNDLIELPNITKIDDFEDSMKKYIEFDTERNLLNENLIEKTDTIKKSSSDAKLDSESVITFQSQNVTSNFEKNCNDFDDVSNESEDEASIKSVVLKKEYFEKIQLSQDETKVAKNEKMKMNNSKDANNSNEPQDKEIFEIENFNETDCCKNFNFEIFQQNLKIINLLEKNIKYGINFFNEEQLNSDNLFFLVNSIRDDLKREFSNHKILVNLTIGENLTDCFQMGFECYLNMTDIFGYYVFQNENIHLIASAYAILF